MENNVDKMKALEELVKEKIKSGNKSSSASKDEGAAEDELLKLYKKITGRDIDEEVEETTKKIIEDDTREKYFEDAAFAPVAELDVQADEEGKTVFDYVREMEDNDDYDELSLKELFAKVEKKKTGIRITPDGMEAYLTLGYGEDTKEEHTEEEVNILLKEAGVTNGIDKSEIHRAILGQMYNQEVLIAKGKPAVNGVDGHFDFKFNTDTHANPLKSENGEIDYKNIYRFEFVDEGDLLCEYIEPTNGVYGVTVTGQLIKPVQGKPKQKLRGKGFRVEDEKRYYAELKGMVELKDGDYLFVDNVLDVDGDVDYTTGNITFDGDVIVHGSVMTGFAINATGNVLVEGIVEAAEISSARDIVLRSGMMGAGTGTLNAGGTIVGCFFERANINCEEDVFGDYFLNCNVQVSGVLYAHGREYTGVIGGTTRALMGIDTDVIGNEIEIKTVVRVGVDATLVQEHNRISKLINTEEDNIKALDEKINLIKNNPAKAEMCLKLLKQRIKTDKKKAALMDELFDMKKVMASASKAAIGVSGIVYPRTTIEVNGLARLVKEQMRKVLITLDDGKIEYFKYSDDVVTRNFKNENNNEKLKN